MGLRPGFGLGFRATVTVRLKLRLRPGLRLGVEQEG